ncbi:glycine cleavage system protein GcvH [Tsukamurella sp. 8F]|uniref:glycine cleavage system protein GcvH n=1 Tax=unclassified Tsukamurella TaxID=2633480 RepID=UPI0023BA0E41|nr:MULTISPECIES: glycine cleavage system protein GcvH [unclassified Tsukamurella]MDF0529123.1 glycine cleavage system protein GcvH [Tsukamurella sp. 8J]MDF0588127.1 glycine cleavage system protein GcvH [Tsukamurella sp. 8F]
MSASTPEELLYTPDHEWLLKKSDTVVRIGITDYAQDQLGDVVFVQLPDDHADVSSGDSFAEVESTKSVSDIYAPLTGVVVAVNGSLDQSPELINSDPYGEGWIVEVEAASPDDLEAAIGELLDADGYKALTSGS